MKDNNVNTENIRTSNNISTSYTDVMNSPKEHIRTFFHFLGSNTLLSFKDIEKINNNSKICYIGYLNMLPELTLNN